MSNIVAELKQQIKDTQAVIDRIQSECSHPKDALIKVNKGDTGNYDPSGDRYWTEFDCRLCGKHWTEDKKK